MDNPLPYFKQGDTFTVAIQMYDEDKGEAIVLDSAMEFECKINLSGNRQGIFPEVVKLNQDNYPGFILLKCLDTSDWNVGIATLDIKLKWSEAIRHSDTFKFEVVRSITK